MRHTHFNINNWGAHFENHAFRIPVIARLIVGILFILFYAITLCNGLKMSDYKEYWLTDFPLIIYWVRVKK